MYVAWDTETTGRPGSYKRPTPSTYEKWNTCRPVSIAAVRFKDGAETESFYRVIKPDDYYVSEESTQIHKISHEEAVQTGVAWKTAFQEFVEFVGDSMMVAHNSIFDENVVHAELIRRGMDTSFMTTHDFRCTYDMYKKKKITRRGKLENVYQEMFGYKFDSAHNALADARACGEIFPNLLTNERKFRDLGISKIDINASSVATGILMGCRDPQELIHELWAKYKPGTQPQLTPKQVYENETKDKPQVRRVIDEIQNMDVSLDSKKEYVSTVLKNNKIETPEAKEYAERSVILTHARSSNQYNSGYFRLHVCNIMGTNYEIVGCPGQVVNGELVCIKQRQRGMFNEVRDYEEIQCQVYMQMLNVSNSRLVERYDGKERHYIIPRDIERYDDIRLRLQNFCEHFHSLLSQ